MPAIVLDGKALSKALENDLKQSVDTLCRQLGRAPKLAVVLVGDNPASKVYVKAKSKRAKKAGIEPVDVRLSADVSNEALQAELQRLSEDSTVDGILLQLPLPSGLDEQAALLAIAPAKDVDGLHPYSQGLLLRGGASFVPCTPHGVMKLIDKAQELLGRSSDLSGKHAVVLGRSVLVGKPQGLLLLERNCTVTYCHSKTKGLAAHCKSADILVAAVGRPKMVKADWVKPGVIVIDVGINRLEDGTLVGDVAYDEVSAVAGALTPVPGGVGPMTISMLLRNTYQAAKRSKEDNF